MRPLDDALLPLYRAAREQDREAFGAVALRGIRRRFDFGAGVWGRGRIGPNYAFVVPSALHLLNLDPDFAAEWARCNHEDPLIHSIPRHIGRALRVRVDELYAASPDSVDAGRRYGINSFAMTAFPGWLPNEVLWLSLYQPDKEPRASDEQLRWLAAAMPHLSEAMQINQALHAAADGQPDADPDAGIAVLDNGDGRLIGADAVFGRLAAVEWPSFDGGRLPRATGLPSERPTTAYIGRSLRISARKSGPMTYLVARRIDASRRLTARQLDIAGRYAGGAPSKRIAADLGLSPATVRNHLAAVYDTLGVHDRMSLVRRLEEIDGG